jgi:hypothetical protein
MDNNTEHSIDCMLLTYGTEYYLLPIVAVAELGSLDGAEYDFMQDNGFGSLLWRELILPLVTPDLQPQQKNLKLPKYAVINALFSQANRPPYFALVIEKHPLRLKIFPENLVWVDKDNQRAVLSKKTDTEEIQNTEVVLLNLFHISKMVENSFQAKSPNNP